MIIFFSRLDSWNSFQTILEGQNSDIASASERGLAFNAIFSQSTNNDRKKLAKIINDKGRTKKLPIFTAMADQWNRDANAEGSGQVSTFEYIEVLLDSVFTLSPSGHNPECFRLFEAAEAGSIPIMSHADLHGEHHPNRNKWHTPHPCKDSLRHWYDAPMVVLDTWEDLYPTVERFMADPAELDKMQRNLRRWYDRYIRSVLAGFDDFVLNSSAASDA